MELEEINPITEDNNIVPNTESEEDNYFEDLGEDLDYTDSLQTGSTALEKHGDLLRQLSDFAPYLKDTVNHWLAIRWDSVQKKYVQDPHIRPLMNLDCASWCIGLLHTYTRGNNIITHIRKTEYNYLMKDIINALYPNIFLRRKEFGITHVGDAQRICTEIKNAAELILMGAGDGQYNELLTKTTNRSESVVHRGDNEDRRLNQNKNTESIMQRARRIAFGGT